VSDPLVPREEARATLAARQELGSEFDEQLVDQFVAKIEKGLDERQSKPPRHERGKGTFELAVVSMIFGIPLTGIAAGVAGLAGLLVAWAGIVLVNLVFAMRR
jgi:hypothetical protein